MANNANDGAFGLEDVPDLPEAPTEQPKYNRDYHRLFVKFMSWLHKRTTPRRLASNPVLWAASNHTHKKAISFYMPIKVPHGMEPPESNQVRSVNEVVKEVKKARLNTAARSLSCMLKQQVHLITGTDDISNFLFALSCKNISEERQCPDQIILGSMDTDFCVLQLGYGAAGREMHSSLLPKAIQVGSQALQRSIPQTFSRLSFCRLHFWLWRSSLLVFLESQHSEVCCNSGKRDGCYC
ncbi:unknown protein [Seminavis robusta]|uniref:Uncharacterized protein n=1 Tax=Seminavis robusta TaxID=568900 RepID=A0A9N8HYA4_9STRA|nr:unknown protein [Seminavis robusta]